MEFCLFHSLISYCLRSPKCPIPAVAEAMADEKCLLLLSMFRRGLTPALSRGEGAITQQESPTFSGFMAFLATKLWRVNVNTKLSFYDTTFSVV